MGTDGTRAARHRRSVVAAGTRDRRRRAGQDFRRGGRAEATVGANDVSGVFPAGSKGGWVGLVEGLADGANRLVATAGGKSDLTLVNHPVNGTLFAGP